jgi:hypothetical protein
MLHPLPLTTFGELAPLGLVAAVYCSRCYETRRIDAERLRDLCFATARFRCAKIRYTGEVCGCPGLVSIAPTTPLPCGGSDTLAFLWCNRCAWEINHVPIDQPPWSVVRWQKHARFRCPGCGTRVEWHIYGPTWRPIYRHGSVRTQGSAAFFSIGSRQPARLAVTI